MGILKRDQAINSQLRYQVRMGDNDLVIKIKYQYKNDFQPYRSIQLEHIDPNDSVRGWDLVSARKNAAPPSQSSNGKSNLEKGTRLNLRRIGLPKDPTES